MMTDEEPFALSSPKIKDVEYEKDISETGLVHSEKPGVPRKLYEEQEGQDSLCSSLSVSKEIHCEGKRMTFEQNGHSSAADISLEFLNDPRSKQCMCCVFGPSRSTHSKSDCNHCHSNNIWKDCIGDSKGCYPTDSTNYSFHPMAYAYNERQPLSNMTGFKENCTKCCPYEYGCLRCDDLENDNAQLKIALEDSKRKARKLKSQIELMQSELTMLRHSKSSSKRKQASPGMLVDVIGEIYSAQRERDEAIMARIHLANDERDVALDKLEELRTRYHSLRSVGKLMSTTFLDEIEDVSKCLETSDDILKNKGLLLQHVTEATLRRKESEFLTDTNYQSLLGQEAEETDEVESSKSSIKLQDSSWTPTGQTQLLQRRLLDEMEARHQAEENCQKLEKLVSVLRRKVNGLMVGRNSVSLPPSPVAPPPPMTASASEKELLDESSA